MKAVSSQKFTTRKLAELFGCSVDTVQRIGNELFGKGQQGVTRRYDEVQATAILEKIKVGQNNQHTLPQLAAENVVTIRLTDTDKEKLDYLTKTLDRSYPWIISHLISAATIRQLQVPVEGNES